MRYSVPFVPFDRVVAYTYDAAVHCVHCAERAHGDPDDESSDENCVPKDAEDSEGNYVHAVLSIDCDLGSVETCDTCDTIICMVCGYCDRSRLPKLDACFNCGTGFVPR